MQQLQLPGQLTQRPMPHPQPMGGMEGGGFQLPQFGGYGGGQMPNRMPLGGLGGGYSQPQPGGGGMGVPLSGMRSYKYGTPRVPRTGPAMLHAGEMVIPAKKAAKMRKVPLSALLKA
jgi:hypothetical protein